MLATIKGADYLYYHKDIQGSVVAVTDAARNLRGQVTYSPFGESGNIAPAASFGYTGQRYDGETGLYLAM